MHSRLSYWGDYIELLKPAEELFDLVFDNQNNHLRAELYKQLLMNISQGYFLYFQADYNYPDWMPFLNSVYLLQPNPDDVYHLAPISGKGIYRITGNRGTVKLLTLAVHNNMVGMIEGLSSISSYHDVDDLNIGPNGELDIIFSAEKPLGYTGNWLHLGSSAQFILARSRSYDWGGEYDARLAIERLDTGVFLKPRLSVKQIDWRIRELLGGFVQRLTRHWLSYQNSVLQQNGINNIELIDFGGVVPVQAYWQGVYSFASDEALILETDIPSQHTYWNVQLNDELWNAVEFVYRQSSLNGHQAQIDSDGHFRAVICLEDPGVANWLDPGGSLQGMIIGRWYGANSLPVPTLKCVPLKELYQHLPANISRVTSEQRVKLLRDRRCGAQLRRRW